MWRYDLNEENWSPVPVHSSTQPSPRSEFAHAIYLDDFIVFGGKGDTELYNDLYIYNVRSYEWSLVAVESSAIPAARRGACMAVSDDFFLIYGGLTASGYSNQLWKFDYDTKGYTLLESLSSAPGSAFSQCHIDTNSDGHQVFRVYMGETFSESSISFLYEYDITIGTWNVIKEAEYDEYSRFKGTVFMINDIILIAGGNSWGPIITDSINVFNHKTLEFKNIGNLPDYTHQVASVYYKNKIYIHGGGDNFGSLYLKGTVKNDLVVIELSDECGDSDLICISECSKGTYYKEGSCHICSEGSFSENIGSVECDLCPSGYFSEIIGAETHRTCTACPYGYYNDQEGQSFCRECPSTYNCAIDRIRPEMYVEALKSESIQPDILDYESEKVGEITMNFNIGMIFLLCVFIITILSFSKTRYIIQELDLYSLRHNYDEGQAMYVRNTLFGGIFTIVFIFAGTAVVFNFLLSYYIDNIRETKGLIPLFSLEQEYKEVIST
jgi:hypothetical protein